MKYIIFGCGKIGKELSYIIDEDCIMGYMDNNPNSFTPDGSELLTFDDIKNSKDFIFVIANSGAYAGQILEQLQDKGYTNYITYEEFYLSVRDRRPITELETLKRQVANTIAPLLRQNKESEVEFYLVDSFEIYHYLPIYRALVKAGIKAEIIAEPPGINTAGDWFDFEEAVEILNKNHVSYCTRSNPDACVAITTQFARNLSNYKGIKIQLTYGNGVSKKRDFQAFPEVASGFDYCLVHGEFKKKILSKLKPEGTIKVIGYPKFIDFFEKIPTKNEILSELNISTKKPILVYYPTWDDYSSIREYSEKISMLRNRFFVIVKPHHCTFRLTEKADELSMLYNIADLVLDGNYNLARITQIADVALCDAASGVFGEIPYYNKAVHMVIIYTKNMTPNDLYPLFQRMCRGVYSTSELYDVVSDIYEKDDWIKDRQSIVDYLFDNDSVGDLMNLVDFIKSLLR